MCRQFCLFTSLGVAIYNNTYARGFRLGGGNEVRKRKIQEKDDQTPLSKQGSNRNVFNNSTSKRLKQQSCKVNAPSVYQTAGYFLRRKYLSSRLAPGQTIMYIINKTFLS